MLGGPMFFVSQVPLAYAIGLVSVFLKCLRQGFFFQRQVMKVWRSHDFTTQISPYPLGNAYIGGVFSSHNRSAGGRTHGTAGVGSVELHAFVFQAIYVWRFVKIGTLTTEVHPAHIVYQNK